VPATALPRGLTGDATGDRDATTDGDASATAAPLLPGGGVHATNDDSDGDTGVGDDVGVPLRCTRGGGYASWLTTTTALQNRSSVVNFFMASVASNSDAVVLS
jgi:hypothetical protein